MANPSPPFSRFDLADEWRRIGSERIDIEVGTIALVSRRAAERHPLGLDAEPDMQRHELACGAGALSRLSRLHSCALAPAAIPSSRSHTQALPRAAVPG
jgi:hypothetical protein